MLEAERYDGSFVIVHMLPVSAGLRCGMGNVQDEIKRAVEVGYWQLTVIIRRLRRRKEPLSLIPKSRPVISANFKRRSGVLSLERTFPEAAEELF